ncbi:ABC transporter ATP-binding protein [Acidaminobacter hydrogenoformans]|uniref:ATP-binding cassette, subfamily B n=1 Tax=Acidaminobacter hydrogenoformans DSM 2784 TaxID=1120920 RepID=A0A1G5RW31_9FIRM|nr:ABC transporter ATP-binding protein [Acidaminobacter hydrogenoformans]SCZ78322.1 ATP-binding cassette, subfamily B [Acidaminobacter hydrogenoformans DSM 2784]
MSRQLHSSNLRKLLQHMKGNVLLYMIAMAAVLLTTLFALTIPLMIRFAIDQVIGGIEADTAFAGWMQRISVSTLFGVAILILAASLLRALFLFIKGVASAAASEAIAKNLKDKVMQHLHEVKFEFFSTHDTGDLIQRATSDVETIRRFLSVQVVEIVSIVLMVGIVSGLMWTLDPRLTVIALSLIPLVIAFSIWFFFRVKERFKIADEAEAKVTSMLQENLSGIKVVKALGREPFEYEKFSGLNLDLKEKVYKLILNFAYFWSLSDFVCLLQIALVMYFGAKWAIEGAVSLGTVVAFITYENMLIFPIRQLGRVLSEFGKTMVAVKRIDEILTAERDEASEFQMDGSETKLLTPEIQGRIEFRKVHFAYPKGEDILKGIDFEVGAGETIGILGPTGSGKSTLAYLLTRLYEPTAGEILLDGIPIRHIAKQHLRRNIGLVLQEAFLYARTIGQNIAIRAEASEAEIIRAAEISAIHHSIEQFDHRYETVVGEKGVSLSGGQRQRVAIARTLLKPMPVMVFDDSLSAVDTETDRQIRQGLMANSAGATVLLISHRITTLMEADRILIIENGRVSAFDTHEALIQQDGLYKRVWEIQNAASEAEDEV